MRIARHVLGFSLALAALSALSGCRGESAAPPTEQETSALPQRPIEAVMNDHVEHWMQIPGVTMVYIGQDEAGTPCIKIGVAELDPERDRQFPAQIEGHRVVVEATGEIRPLSN